LVRGPVTLELGIVTVNATLPVGKTTQQVVVTTDVPMLTTESGAQEGVMEADTIVNLPQVGGLNGGGADWENFIILLPGSSGAPENSSNNLTSGMATSINGNLPFASMLQDGATTTLPMSQNSDVTVFETTAEVKVSSSAFSAQYGVGDVVYNQITKSGGDHFHGAGYEYFQNNALNAATYAFGTGTIPVLHFNNFGGAVGGPIIKHKAFFFFDYDRTIDHGGASTGFSTEPTAAMMAGDFTGNPTIYDPTTQVLKTTGTCTYASALYPGGVLSQAAPCVQRQSFASEYGGGNVIPTGMISPVAQAIQKLFPASNTAGTPVAGRGYNENNFVYNAPSTNPFIKWFGRMDYDTSSSNRLTLAETESDNPGQNVNEGICPFNCFSGDVSRDNASVSDVWSPSSHFINEARMGFTDQLNFFVPQTLNQGWPAKLGLQFAEVDLFPSITINDSSGANFDGNLQPGTNAVYKEYLFDPSDVVTLIKGKHVLHFGGEFLINRADSTNWGNLNAASLTFGGTYTAQGGNLTAPYDGMGYADFLLGQTQQWSAQNVPEYGGRWKTPQFFVQDDWKMKPNLTINLGVRYEIMTGWSGVRGNEAVWDPAVTNFNVSSSAVNGIAPGAPVLGGMWYAFSGANGRTTLQAPKYNIVMPRAGFSWQVFNNMVVRGGLGVYSATWSEDTYGQGLGAAFGSNGGINDTNTTNGLCPVVSLSATPTSPNTQDPGCGVPGLNPQTISQAYITAPTTPWAQNGQNPTYNQYHTPIPTNYQFSLSVEQQFLKDYVASVSYVGNHGDHLNTGPLDIDQVPESELGQGATATPYPLFSSVNGSTNNAVSNYNALQALITKRMTYGLQFSVNYTWSHFLDDMDSSGWGSRMGWQNYQNAYAINQNYSNSNFDIRNMLKGEVVYKLPFGKGMHFLNNNLITDEVVGGWQVAGTFVDQGGNPMGITTGCNNNSGNLSGCYTQEADLIGNYKTGGGTISQWFNPAAFAIPAPNTYGTFLRNTVYGPGLNVLNFSFGKSFAVLPDRGVNFEIRADSQNVLNHPSFGQPNGTVVGTGSPTNITSTTIGGRTFQIYGRLSF
ncbi:MAG: carboxypeptidase regulatory-like domain-containing protein, partial [Terracidiphilus sp.]